jgi:hypothetical protein
MLIIGCGFHTRYQQIAMANGESGELLLERRLGADGLRSAENPALGVSSPHFPLTDRC